MCEFLYFSLGAQVMHWVELLTVRYFI